MIGNIYKLIPSLIIGFFCLFSYCLQSHFDFNYESCLESKMLYIFSHSNLFHLALNLIALFQFRPRFKTCLIAYIASFVATFIPLSSMSIPTCGLSAFIMACYARRYYTHGLNYIPLVVFNLMLAFVPLLNWKLHLISFFISYLIYGASHQIKTYRRS